MRFDDDALIDFRRDDRWSEPTFWGLILWNSLWGEIHRQPEGGRWEANNL